MITSSCSKLPCQPPFSQLDKTSIYTNATMAAGAPLAATRCHTFIAAWNDSLLKKIQGVKSNKKSFCRYTGDKRRLMFSPAFLQQEIGDLVTVDMEKAEVLNFWLCLHQEVLQTFHSSYCLGANQHSYKRQKQQGLAQQRTTCYRTTGLRPSKEAEGAQVHGNWWNASMSPKGTVRGSG